MSKEMKWIVTGQETSRHVATIREVCDTPGQRKELWIADVAKHHAQLIASAPALLEALEELEDALTHTGPCQCCAGSNDEGHEDNCRVIQARNAIAKARGER